MYRSYALHRIDPNDIASTERWYVTRHGPEIGRRYGPWLERMESFRAVEAPADAGGYGIANYYCTEGIWREMPDPADKGILGMTQPPKHARPFSCIVPVQATDDFKGWLDAPDSHYILRWVQLMEYPQGVDPEQADQWYREVFAPQAVLCPSLNRFFGFRAVSEDLHVAGHWSAGESTPEYAGVPGDHHWDRVTEMWFDDFRGWRAFVNSSLPVPPWAETDRFPFLEPDTHFVSSFLLEMPSYDWLTINRAFV